MNDRSSTDNSLLKLRILLHLACVSVTVGILLGAGVAVYKPVHAEEVRVRNVTGWTENFLSKRGALDENSRKLDARRLESDSLFAEAMTRIPETAEKTEFLSQLSQLASNTGLKIHEFRPGDEVDRKTHRELSIHVTGEASYASLCQFLAGLEKVKRLTQLASLQVNGSYGDTNTYPVSMTVNIFFAPLAVNEPSTGEGDEAANF